MKLSLHLSRYVYSLGTLLNSHNMLCIKQLAPFRIRAIPSALPTLFRLADWADAASRTREELNSLVDEIAFGD